MGDLCDLELQCALVPAGGSHFTMDGACITQEHGQTGRYIRCTCTQLGTVAVLRFRLTPATNAPGSSLGLSRVAPQYLRAPQVWALPCAVCLFLLLLLIAHVADLHLLYIDMAHQEVPPWMSPGTPFTLLSELRHYILTRTSVMRVFFVWPGFVPYTHAQNLMILTSGLMGSALCIVLFVGRESEQKTIKLRYVFNFLPACRRFPFSVSEFHRNPILQ